MVNDNSDQRPKQEPLPDKPKHPGGRPTKYREEFCQQVIDMGREGKGKAAMAAELDVDRVTLYQWTKTIPEFNNALTRALDLSAAWWEEKGRKGVDDRNFNANAYSLQVRNRFPEDWQDKRELGITPEASFFGALTAREEERIDMGEDAPTIEIEAETPQDGGVDDPITGDGS